MKTAIKATVHDPKKAKVDTTSAKKTESTPKKKATAKKDA